MAGLIQDGSVAKAITGLVQRAEREEDPDRLARTFVDAGILDQLKSNNNQVIYGRRGTGKTHVLKVLEQQPESSALPTTVYIDLRTIGSSTFTGEEERPSATRALGAFQDIMSEIHSSLLNLIIGDDFPGQERAFEELSRLSTAVLEAKYTGGPISLEEVEQSSKQIQGKFEFGVTGCDWRQKGPVIHG